MRILYWTPFFPPDLGGIETWSASLLPHLQEYGHEFVVLTSYGSHPLPEVSDYKGIPVHRLHSREAFNRRSLALLADVRRKIAGLKRTFKPDVVHMHVADPSVMFHLSTLEAHPSASVVTIHHQIHSQIPERGHTLTGQILNQADWVVTVSRAIHTELSQLAPQINSRSSVIYCSIPSPSVAPAPLPWDPPVLLCLGRLIPKKGFDLALQALVRIRASFPAVRLVIAGEGPLRGELEKQASALGVRDAVELRGRVEPAEVPALINACTALLMPSRSEGLSLVALEAASMARPLVSTTVGGQPEVVLPQQTGLLVEPENSTALSEAVLGLLQNPASATAMGQAARRHVLANFSLDACAERHDQLYRQLVRRCWSRTDAHVSLN